METAFRYVEEEGVIGSQEVEYRQEAEGEALSEAGYRGGEDQCEQNEQVGEGVQEDEGL